MCLLIERTDVNLVAEEDIPCVKILTVKSKWNGNIYTTPYKRCVVKPKQIVESELIREYAGTVYEIVNIGIHTFKADAKEAIQQEIEWFTKTFDKVIAVECIIPKGATYCIGSFDKYIDKCYASTKLIYSKRFRKYI